MTKIVIIGSTHYIERIKNHAKFLIASDNEVRIPAFDDHPDLDAYGVCEFNRSLIEWADEVHFLWDRRSMGAIFDFGVCFALRKPFKIIYLEEKTFEDVMKTYERYSNNLE